MYRIVSLYRMRDGNKICIQYTETPVDLVLYKTMHLRFRTRILNIVTPVTFSVYICKITKLRK